MIKNFCDEHWGALEHGEEPMKPDAGGRMMTFLPDGETCSFCAAPVTHTADYVEPPPVVIEELAPAKKPSLRPSKG